MSWSGVAASSPLDPQHHLLAHPRPLRHHSCRLHARPVQPNWPTWLQRRWWRRWLRRPPAWNARHDARVCAVAASEQQEEMTQQRLLTRSSCQPQRLMTGVHRSQQQRRSWMWLPDPGLQLLPASRSSLERCYHDRRFAASCDSALSSAHRCCCDQTVRIRRVRTLRWRHHHQRPCAVAAVASSDAVASAPVRAPLPPHPVACARRAER